MHPAIRLFLVFIFISFAYAKAMTTDKANQLVISTLNAAKKEPFFSLLSEPTTYGDLQTLDEFKLLTSNAEDVWANASQNLNAVAPTQEARIILFQSFEGLSPESYLAFINKALEFYQNKMIDQYDFTGFILLPENNQQWFLAYNYQDPRVRAFLMKVKGVFANDPRMASSIDHILSGGMKKADDERRAENPYLGRQPIPLLGGSLSHAAQTPMAAAPDSSGMRASQPATSATPTVAQAVEETHSHFPIAWIVAGAIALIIGGLFAWKKLS